MTLSRLWKCLQLTQGMEELMHPNERPHSHDMAMDDRSLHHDASTDNNRACLHGNTETNQNDEGQ
jgi:hypothetical protein